MHTGPLTALVTALSTALSSPPKDQAAPVRVVVRARDAGARAVEPELKALLGKTLERYTTLFGGPAKDSTGKPLDSVVVELTSGPFGGGESDPGFIQLAVGATPFFGF